LLAGHERISCFALRLSNLYLILLALRPSCFPEDTSDTSSTSYDDDSMIPVGKHTMRVKDCWSATDQVEVGETPHFWGS
jgi:hypothetical protein